MYKAAPILLMLLLVLGLIVPVSAQSVPTVINYQGRLTDNTPGQNPIDTTVPMTFHIYGSLAGVDLEWSEAWGQVAVTGGIFNVLLGSNGAPIPPNLFTSSSSRYLEIVVNGETLTPRQQLGAGGWANQAANAADLDCVGCVDSAIVQDSSITSADIAPDTLMATDLAPGSVTASEIQADAVDTSEIKANAVGGSELDNAGVFNVNSLTANGGSLSSYTTGSTGVYSDATSGSTGSYGLFGIGNFVGLYAEGNGGSANTYGVYGRGVDTGTTSYGVYGDGGDYGVYGNGTAYGVYGLGGTYGVYAKGSTSTPYALYADTDDNSGTAYGVISYANGAGGSSHYGGYFSASGATNNYGLYATGSSRAGYFNGELYVTRNSSISEPHIELYEAGAGDYSRVKFRTNGSSNSWDISGLASNTLSSGWLRFYSSGYGGNVLSLRADGFVYLHRLSSGYTNDLCTSTSSGGYLGSCSSSLRYKQNILDLDLGLNTVMEMRPVTFEWKRDGREDLGFVAEEMSALNPILATYNEEQEPEGVRYRQLTAVLARAIQEQQKQIEALQAQLKRIEAARGR